MLTAMNISTIQKVKDEDDGIDGVDADEDFYLPKIIIKTKIWTTLMVSTVKSIDSKEVVDGEEDVDD